MSCYQNLTLNNNTGDLAVTSGNTVNLVQAIQNFGIRTPVVDFQINGNIISLFYRDATGTMQVKNVTIPAATTGNNSAISVANTSSITSTIALGVITSSVNVSSANGNTLIVNADGLFVPTSTTGTIQVENTPSVSMTYQGGIIGAIANISAAAGNTLSLNTDGLFVPPNTVTTAQIRNVISATAPIAYNSATGVISSAQANGSTSGYLSSADWTTFANMISNVVSVGSSSSTQVLSAVTAGIAGIRGISGTNGIAVNLLNQDIIISATPTVPQVNAGPLQQISNVSSSTTLSGTSSVSNGQIISNTWTTLTGPNTPTISDRSSLSPTVSGLVVGTYRFRLSSVASTGLVSTGDVSVNVFNGAITQDNIYIGINGTGSIPTPTQVLAGALSLQYGGNDVSADWSGLTASAAQFCWFAIPNNGGTYFKTKWFVTAFNNGLIGTATGLFGSYTVVNINGVAYNVCISNYETQFSAVCLLQA